MALTPGTRLGVHEIVSPLGAGATPGCRARSPSNSFPPPEQPVMRFQVATDAKLTAMTWPRISPDDTLQAVPVSTGGTLEPGVPTPLFKRTIERSGIIRRRSCATSDGQRFVVNAARETGHSPPFAVVLNWPATLTRK